MIKNHDPIPTSDEDFDPWLKNLIANAAILGISVTKIAALTTAYNIYHTNLGAWQDLQPIYNGKAQAKDTARATAETLAREAVSLAQADLSVTDEQRKIAGLPVHKTTRTTTPVPVSFPVLGPVQFSHLLHMLAWTDSASGQRAKPDGVQYCEIRRAIIEHGAPVPEDPDLFAWITNDTASPYSSAFEVADLRKTACYLLRWVSSNGQPGPWSSVTPADII